LRDVSVNIMIAARNEANSLDQLMVEMDVVLPVSGYTTTVIIIDDASTDTTPMVLKDLQARYSYLSVIRLEQQGGQTGCYAAAIAQSSSDYIIRLDGDLQDNPTDLNNFFTILKQKPDMIMGLRTMRKHRRLLRLLTMLYDAFIMALMDTSLHTHSSSFIAFKSIYIKDIKMKKNDHRYLPLIAIARGATQLTEIIVSNRDRVHGKSNYGNYKKMLVGIPEVIAFMTRLFTGYYDQGPRLNSSMLSDKKVQKEFI
jgi:glycosyltransferase involved in cell wall biosynthesis